MMIPTIVTSVPKPFSIVRSAVVLASDVAAQVAAE